jgi:hypothetical protein
MAFGYNAGEDAMVDVARGDSKPLSVSYIEDFRFNSQFAARLVRY